MKSEILIVGHPQPDRLDIGADVAPGLVDEETSYAVVVAPISTLGRLSGKEIRSTRYVLILDMPDQDRLKSLIEERYIYRILPTWTDPEFENSILAALSEHRHSQQQRRLLQTLRDQNDHLTKLTADIERQVEFRLNELDQQRRSLVTTQARLRVIHQALISAFRAGSVPELESKITDSLKSEFNVEWTRIRYTSQSGTESTRMPTAIAQFSLMREGHLAGTVAFGRTGEPFDREERRLLDQVVQTINLILRRLERRLELERARIGWEATFDAIREPLSIIDANRDIIRVNQEFAAAAQIPIDQISGRKCYEVLFKRTQPCQNCELGHVFRLDNNFEVSSQNAGTSAPLLVGESERTLYLNLYRDLSAKLKAEKRLIESAKLAELGTISSSIAHELNNPLGGMLAYIQLISADLKNLDGEAARLKEDVAEIESSIRRCSEIVKSLLIYIRKNPELDDDVSDIREAIEQAVQIVSLQTRALGIQIEVQQAGNDNFRIGGSFNLIVQLFCLILQQSNLALQRRRLAGDSQPLRSIITLSTTPDLVLAKIEDTGRYDLNQPEEPSSIIQQLLNELDASSSVEIREGMRRLLLEFPRIRSEMTN